MQDTTLYETILGLQRPWHIARVELNTSTQRIELWAEHEGDTRWPCPECADPLPCFDHAPARTWRHLDTCQFETHVHARAVSDAWRQTSARALGGTAGPLYVADMERLVIDVIHQCSTLTGACRLLRISWDEAWVVMERAVARGQGETRSADAVCRRR